MFAFDFIYSSKNLHDQLIMRLTVLRVAMFAPEH